MADSNEILEVLASVTKTDLNYPNALKEARDFTQNVLARRIQHSQGNATNSSSTQTDTLQNVSFPPLNDLETRLKGLQVSLHNLRVGFDAQAEQTKDDKVQERTQQKDQPSVQQKRPITKSVVEDKFLALVLQSVTKVIHHIEIVDQVHFYFFYSLPDSCIRSHFIINYVYTQVLGEEASSKTTVQWTKVNKKGTVICPLGKGVSANQVSQLEKLLMQFITGAKNEITALGVMGFRKPKRRANRGDVIQMFWLLLSTPELSIVNVLFMGQVLLIYHLHSYLHLNKSHRIRSNRRNNPVLRRNLNKVPLSCLVFSLCCHHK